MNERASSHGVPLINEAWSLDKKDVSCSIAAFNSFSTGPEITRSNVYRLQYGSRCNSGYLKNIQNLKQLSRWI